jgi:CDP-diacylglycerol---glycerol-3-phosphate 3-phosphatidyltransferase
MNLPNILTLVRIALVPVFIMFFYIDIAYNQAYALLIFLIATFTDFADGVIARRTNCITDFGKLMDPMADKLLVCAGVIMLVSVTKIHPVIGIILISREFIISSFRLLAVSNGKVIAAGVLGKYKTVFQFLGICILLVADYLPKFVGSIGDIVIYISAVLAVWSCVDYVIKNKGIIDLDNI